MSKSTKMIIALGVIILLVGGYYGSIIWQQNRPPEEDQRFARPPSDPAIRLGDVWGDDIVKIEIPNMILERKDGVWELLEFENASPPDWIELDQRVIGNLAFAYASIMVDSIIEEEPEDLSIYGLEVPDAWARVTMDDGEVIEYFRGSLTPSRSSYYFMVAGDPRVFAVSMFAGEGISMSLDLIRTRISLPRFEYMDFTRLAIITPSYNIEINPTPEIRPTFLATSYSTFQMNSPYVLPRGLDSEVLYELVESINTLMFVDYIDDNPSSLAQYGLDNPVRLIVESPFNTLDLLIGSPIANNLYYAQVYGDRRVISVGGLNDVMMARPFPLLLRSALILSIDIVERMTITGGPLPINVTVRDGMEENAIFTFNGRRVEDTSFRFWYRTVIGLAFDSEIPDEMEFRSRIPSIPPGEIIHIEYELNLFQGARASISLIPYNRDFYALLQEGQIEFLISRNQVNRIWEAAENLEYLD